MTQATKTLGAIFAVLLVLTVIARWNSGPSASKALRTNIVSLDTAKVDRLEIQNRNVDPIVLEKQSGVWKVKASDNKFYEVEKGAVRDALTQLIGMKAKSVATRDAEKYARFQVDETGTTVKAFQGNKELGGAIIGKFNFVSQTEFNTYVKPLTDETVYTVEGFIASSFNREADAWRNKEVWSLSRAGMAEIAFNYPDSAFTMTRVGSETWVSGMDTLRISEVTGIIGRLAALRADGFIPELNTQDLKDPLYSIQVKLDNGVERRLFLHKMEEHSGNFVARANEYPYVFKLGESSFKSSVLKSRKTLLQP